MTTPQTPPRTYAQVAASPPTTPRIAVRAITTPTPPKRTPTPGTIPQEPGGTGDTDTQLASPAARPQPSIRDGKHGDRGEQPTTPGPCTPRLWPEETRQAPLQATHPQEAANLDTDASMEDLDPPRRYGTPTSEDWRNLSIHGDESVASDVWADVIGDTVLRDEIDVENFVTDGVDRFGNTIPGQEAHREELRTKKRQRLEDSPQRMKPTKSLSVRFRKYRERPTPARGPEQNRQQTASHDTWPEIHETTPSPPRIPTHEKEKGVERTLRPASDLLHRRNNTNTKDIPWSALSLDMEVDEDQSLVLPQLFEGVHNSPSPSTRFPAGTRQHHSGTYTPRDQNRRPPADEQGSATSSHVEVLPSFLAPPPDRAERAAGTGQAPPTEGTHIQVIPATPGTDGYTFTPEPTGGYPTIHHSHPEGLIEDLAMSRIDEAWKCEEGTVLFVHVANIGYPEAHMRKPIHDEIYGVISHITGETAFVPIAPQPEWVPPPGRTGTPKTWAIRGLSKSAATKLANRRVLSSVWITLFVYERKLVIPTYLFTLSGYTTNHGNDIVDSIKSAFASDPIYSTILDLVQGHPTLKLIQPEEATTRILRSVNVRIDQLSNGNMQAAVFCDSPTGCGETWKQWRTDLMRLPFHSQYNPTATARRLELCLCCHSADHVTHKCPFPSMQGWNAPPVRSRTFGRARQQPPPEQQQQSFRPATPMPQHAIRGRGRGGGQYRGGRSMMPTHGIYHAAPSFPYST